MLKGNAAWLTSVGYFFVVNLVIAWSYFSNGADSCCGAFSAELFCMVCLHVFNVSGGDAFGQSGRIFQMEYKTLEPSCTRGR